MCFYVSCVQLLFNPIMDSVTISRHSRQFPSKVCRYLFVTAEAASPSHHNLPVLIYVTILPKVKVAKSLNNISFLMSCNFIPSFILSVQTFSFIWRTLNRFIFAFVIPYKPHCGGQGYSYRLYFTVVMIRLMLLSSQKQKLGDFHVVLDNCHPNNHNDNCMAWGCITLLTLGTVQK